MCVYLFYFIFLLKCIRATCIICLSAENDSTEAEDATEQHILPDTLIHACEQVDVNCCEALPYFLLRSFHRFTPAHTSVSA